MHDDLTQLLAGGDGEGADGAPTGALASFWDSVMETLHRNGVTSFTIDGDTVDRARQRVIRVIDTVDPALDRRVADRLRPGFELDGRVLRPEWVAVYRHVPATETT
jgi:molecular chaperone GrpE (heat shock protein)